MRFKIEYQIQRDADHIMLLAYSNCQKECLNNLWQYIYALKHLLLFLYYLFPVPTFIKMTLNCTQ